MASLVVILTLLAFATYRMIIMVTRDNPNVSKQSFMRDLDAEDALIPADYGYNMAFGLPKLMDPSFGRYLVNTVTL